METSSFQRELESLQGVLRELLESQVMEEFAKVWEEIGIEEAHRQGRRETMKLHLQSLLEEMVQEEVVLKDKLVDSVNSCSAELAQLCEQLSLPCELPPETATLITKEKMLRTKVDSLAKEKHDRMKRLKRLTELECAMCESIGEPPHLTAKWQSQAVPSEEQLVSYRKRIEELEETKDQRQGVFFKIREKVLRIWEELEVEPEGELELSVAKGDIKTFVLSVDNMKLLEEFHLKLLDSAVELEAQALRLRESIQSLWVRLEVPEGEREAFTAKHPGYKPKVIKILEAEVKRLNELKKQNLQKFVEATRKELHKIWDLCYFGEEQRREFAAAYSSDFTDDLLSAHESELDRMRGFHGDNQDVFKLVEKRESLWSRYEEFEKKASDPARFFKNRGGQLLKDEKLKKQISKELPKVEKELKAMLSEWENDHERYFIIRDTRYLDTIEHQWQEKNETKEKEKMKRQKSKQETTVMEMHFGSKPNTPIKRRGPPSTPTSAPGKVRRVGPSPLIQASQHGSRLTRTAAAHGSKRPPTGNTSGKTPKRRLAAGGRKILGDRNTTTTINTDESFLSQASSSMASTGSYTDFHAGLIQGLESQRTARSSAVPKSSSLNHLT